MNRDLDGNRIKWIEINHFKQSYGFGYDLRGLLDSTCNGTSRFEKRYGSYGWSCIAIEERGQSQGRILSWRNGKKLGMKRRFEIESYKWMKKMGDEIWDVRLPTN